MKRSKYYFENIVEGGIDGLEGAEESVSRVAGAFFCGKSSLSCCSAVWRSQETAVDFFMEALGAACGKGEKEGERRAGFRLLGLMPKC